uniref:Protein phosphatase 2 regulatory subunit B''alpha n=1 Tax=Cynoglossus semilaevis TaxID=244447 RepID=A0A3P8UTW6_CYNSE
MAAAYRVVVSSVSCYNSVVVDRRTHSHAVHYCSGPCGALTQGLDCTVAHRGTCSELLVAPDIVYTETNNSPIQTHNIITQQLSNHGKIGITTDTSSLKDITEEAINLASGKLKEFSFDKLRLSSSSHVTFRKGRKVRPDSFSRRSTDLEIIYGHFSSNITTNGMTNGAALEETKLKSTSSILSANTKSSGGSIEENLIARLLEKTRLEAGSGGAGGEDIRACLDILLKCSEDLKKCTDIIKQCIKRKAGGGSGEGAASPDSMYRAVMTRLSTYLKRLPLELEGIGGLGVTGPGSGHNDLAELVSTLHSIQQGPYSPIFGNEQPPRYEDVVQSPPMPNTVSHSASTSLKSDSIHAKSVHTSPSRTSSLTNGLQHSYSSSALYIEEEESDVGKIQEQVPQQTVTPRGFNTTQNKQGTVSGQNFNQSQPYTLQTSLDKLPTSAGFNSFPSLPVSAPKSGSHRNDDIDKLLMDLENLSQSMSRPRGAEPPLPAKTRKREGAQVMSTQQKMSQFQIQNPTSHLVMNGPSYGPPPRTPPQGQNSETGVGEEEDGALLLRILESIESFAQELVDSGPGSTGSAERKCGKEREVMRLLQDTLATTGRADTPPAAAPTFSTAAPAIPPKQCLANTRAVSPVPTTYETVTNSTSELVPKPSPEVSPKPLPTPMSAPTETIEAVEVSTAAIQELTACGCPLYWKAPMFYSAGGERTGFVSVHSFIATWRKLLHSCHDDASRFIYLLAKPGLSYLEQEDFIPLLQDIVDTHPGLTFLKDAPEFHSRYITTVIQRIFYIVNRSWTGRITMMELRRSNFLQTLALLEEEDDINQITDYFSYEHFYVIYCKFWELDTDHDLYIDPKDLSRYNDHASSSRIIERLFSGAVTRGSAVQREGRMSYAEFVWFLISEEDKKNPTSIEYWFRCMDVDGDGVLSMFELEFFYEEQCERMERMGIEPLPFQDLLCQMLDLVKPESPGKITLTDLKRCRMAHIFFDTFFNLEKYLDHEQRDPFAVQKDIDSEGPEPSDWDKYASEEYEILVAEETKYFIKKESLLSFPQGGDMVEKCPLKNKGLHNKGMVRKVSPQVCYTSISLHIHRPCARHDTLLVYTLGVL